MRSIFLRRREEFYDRGQKKASGAIRRLFSGLVRLLDTQAADFFFEVVVGRTVLTVAVVTS